MRYLQYGQIKTTNHQFWTFRDLKSDQRKNLRDWILILRINFRQSKQKESSILHSPEL